MRKKLIFILLGIIFFAAFLGLYAQNIAYYFEEHLFYIQPLLNLTLVTVLSISLFILVFVVKMILLAFEQLRPKQYLILLTINVIVGFSVSLWSLFVLAMSWH